MCTYDGRGLRDNSTVGVTSKLVRGAVDIWLVCVMRMLVCVVCAGFCKQQLWPLFHYVLPMSPSSAGRFNSELWQAYVKANKVCLWQQLLGRRGVLACQAGVLPAVSTTKMPWVNTQQRCSVLVSTHMHGSKHQPVDSSEGTTEHVSWAAPCKMLSNKQPGCASSALCSSGLLVIG